VREARKVLDLILRLRHENKAVLVVSHAMDHVMEVGRPRRRAAAWSQGRRADPDR
jgi:energy-coupling factor transporter ATP-binding protein EcfA2